MADGWTTCGLGHRHWGLVGAAGLLVHRSGPGGVELLLQQRAAWTQHGGTWGIPGGALQFGERPEDAALREAGEELGIRSARLSLGGSLVDDHGGWSYTTVLAQPFGDLPAASLRLDAESAAVRWTRLLTARSLPLHPGFRATLPRLLDLAAITPSSGTQSRTVYGAPI